MCKLCDALLSAVLLHTTLGGASHLESGKPPVKRSRFKEARERAKVHVHNVHVQLYSLLKCQTFMCNIYKLSNCVCIYNKFIM